MKIWIDADACPNVVKEILYRASQRTKTELILVANQPLTAPASAFIRSIQVGAGFDVADNYIVQQLTAGEHLTIRDVGH